MGTCCSKEPNAPLMDPKVEQVLEFKLKNDTPYALTNKQFLSDDLKFESEVRKIQSTNKTVNVN